MKSIVILIVFLIAHTSARALHFDHARRKVVAYHVTGPDDNPYGPVEINSWRDNHYHDSLHGDDRWPDLTHPAAAVRRLAATEAASPSPTPTGDFAASAHTGWHHGLVVVPLTSTVAGSSTTVVKDETTVVTIAPVVRRREVIRRGPLDDDLRSLSATNIFSSTSLTSTEEAAALSTGAQQWQSYWEHGAATLEVPTKEAKAAALAKTVASIQDPAAAMMALSKWLANTYPHRKFQDHDGQNASIAIITTCNVMSRTFPQLEITELDTQDLATSMMKMCDLMAQFFPHRKIQNRDLDGVSIAAIREFLPHLKAYPKIQTRASTLHRDIQTDNLIRHKEMALFRQAIELLNSSPEQARNIETHSSYASIKSHTSQIQEFPETHLLLPPSTIPDHHGFIGPRGFFPFDPLIKAYNKMNDVYNRVTNAFPKPTTDEPDETIYGCTHIASTDRIICPADGQEGMAKRDLPEISSLSIARRGSTAESVITFLARALGGGLWSWMRNKFIDTMVGLAQKAAGET